MKKWIVLFVLSLNGLASYSQSHLKSQVSYCKSEVERLELEVTKLKQLLQIQNTDLVNLKSTIVEKNSEIENLNQEIEDLNQVSVDLMNLAINYEDGGDYRKALEVYKLLIKNYPESLESASSRLKIREMTKKVVNEREKAKLGKK